MAAQAGGDRAGDGLVASGPGDSVLTVRAVVAMCALAARSHPEVADVLGSPEVLGVGTATSGGPHLRVRMEVVGTYGADLTALATDVRRSVVVTVTDMTGLEVSAVDVAVIDVSLPATT